MDNVYCCVAVTKSDGKRYQHSRLSAPAFAGMFAALAIAEGALEATIYRDEPEAALVEARNSGNLEVYGRAWTILGDARAASIIAEDDRRAEFAQREAP